MGIITIIFVICLILAVFNAICKIASLADKDDIKIASRIFKGVFLVIAIAGLVYCLPVFPAGILG